MFQGIALDVEIAKKKKPERDQQEERLDEHRPLPNVLILIVMFATVSGLCLCIYHVTVRVSRLEQRAHVMSSRECCATTSTSVAERRRQTTSADASSSSSAAPSTVTISHAIRSPDNVKDWEELSDETYSDVGSGQNEDDDDGEEDLSVDERWTETYDSRTQKYNQLISSYDLQVYSPHRRSKRSPIPVSDGAADSEAMRRPRQHQHQYQHQQHQLNNRRRGGYRDTPSGTGSNPTDRDSSRHNARMSRRQGRRRHRPHADTQAG